MNDSIIRGCKLVVSMFAVVVFAGAPGCDDGAQSDEGGDDQVCVGGKCDDVDPEQGFEFIIIGSGAGGGPLAANLARNNHRVLLLEAGSDQGGNINYQVPAYDGFSTEDPAMRWDYFVDHYSDPSRAGRDQKMVLDEAGKPKGILYPRAGTLGGCTAHNAMIMIEAHDSDWNKIAEATGDRSWGADVMRPYSERVFRWLGTETVDTGTALFDFKLQSVVMAGVFAFVDATGEGSLKQLFSNIEQLKSLLRKDINADGPGVEGVYPFPLAMDAGKRRGVREYLLETVDAGFPLQIETGTFVTKLVYDDRVDEDGRPIVIGVEFVRGDHVYRADPNAPASGELQATQQVLATREVIMSAGAFNTPQILKLSGIGPRAELDAMGVPVKADVPGVGENLQDRYEVGIVSKTRGEFSVLKECTLGQDPATDPCLADWAADGSGPYASNGGAVTIVKRSSRELIDPDLFIFGVPGKFGGYEPGYSTDALADRSLFTWLILKGHTKNKAGTVKLRSTDPRDTPDIDFHYFDEGDVDNGEAAHDRDAMIRAVAFVRDIGRKTRTLMGSPFFGRFDEISPGPDASTADEVGDWVQDEAWGHHASCTAKIGGEDDPMAVLDSRFRVRGVSGLRVVDASVFPEIPGFFIVLPTFMVSEKATDVILADLGETRIEANQP